MNMTKRERKKENVLYKYNYFKMVLKKTYAVQQKKDEKVKNQNSRISIMTFKLRLSYFDDL